MENVCVVIPAYEPGEELKRYVRELFLLPLGNIIVVDDGSGENFGQIFTDIERADSRTTVLRHEANRGKGRALKTAFEHVRDHLPHIRKILCVDCDGQHSASDVEKAAKEERAETGTGSLFLGSRDFRIRRVPLRSWIGNRLSSLMLWSASGIWLWDTQTGMRIFDRELLDLMIATGGERFEYETKMLIECARQKIPVRSFPIETIYENGNKGSHFRPIKDSLRIGGILFPGMARFLMSSLAGACTDILCFHIMYTSIHNVNPADVPGLIVVCTVTARAAASAVNFLLNRKYVFRHPGAEGSLRRYLCTAAGMMACSAAGAYLLSMTAGIHATAAKALCDTLLFFVSYNIQKRWVFRGNEL